MARVTSGLLSDEFVLSVGLDRYQELMRLPIAGFNGLNRPDEEPVYQCSQIWKQGERDDLAMHLASAEEMRELELGYHLAPKWLEDEEHEYSQVVVLDRKHLIEVGSPATSDIELGAALTLGADETDPNDPVVLTVTTTVTDTDEICVFYPGEDVRIRPSSVAISGGVATINIPRSRLVDPDLMDNREDHLSYYENDNFITTVDVKRCYTDDSDVATIRWLGTSACTEMCSLYTQTACAVAAGHRVRRISKIIVTPASYSSGTWASVAHTYCHTPVSLLVSYKSGRRNSIKTELLTARLAHTLMPNRPSSCPTVHMYWEKDTKVQDVFTPYGYSVGAFNAWVIDSRDKVAAGGIF